MSNNELPIEWSDRAKYELIDYYEYIGKDSKRQAKKVVNEIKGKVKDLNIFPEKFPKEPNFAITGRNIRWFPIYSVKVLYEIKPDCIMVLRVFHTSQSPDKISL